MENIIGLIERFVWSLPLICMLFFIHIYFTIKLKFPQFRLGGVLREILSKKGSSKENNSSYKTLMATLAGTLGTGNIIGVASAITLGGIGSLFWIFVSGFLAIATKYAETYIVLKYRRKDKKGKYHGGTMYVLRDRTDKQWLAIFFSIFVIIASFGIGAMIQSNSAVICLNNSFHIKKEILAVIVTVVGSYILLGNVKKIANISSVLVPIASSLYLIMCFYILLIFRNNIVTSIINIVKEGLNIKAFFTGTGIMYLLNMISSGLSKGVFSNEAGMGSSPMFDATSDEEDIKMQSKVASLSVLIDTLIFCMLTGITICSTYGYLNLSDPTELVNYVFSKFPCGEIFLSISISVFAIATIPCWSYYGEVAVNFIFRSKKIYVYFYKALYIFAIYFGGTKQISIIWAISSIANAFMSIPNLYMLLKERKEIFI